MLWPHLRRLPEYTHFDHQGSAVAATNASGAILWRERYSPWGTRLLKPPGNKGDTGYTGHLMDAATELVYMQARYYDSQIGRFYSTDPVGYEDQLNLYAYVGNDPVNATDPTGMSIEGGCAGGNGEMGSQNCIPLLDGDGSGGDTKPQRPGAPSGVTMTTSRNEIGLQINITPTQSDPDLAETAFAAETIFMPAFALFGGGVAPSFTRSAGRLVQGSAFSNAASSAVRNLTPRPDVVLSGGRSGQLVKTLTGPPNSVVRGGSGRVFVTNQNGQVILDITRSRVKPVTPGQGFGPKRSPSAAELHLLEQTGGGG